MVTDNAAGSIAVTLPVIPRFFHSSTSFCCIDATSLLLMIRTELAARFLGSALWGPTTTARSPVAMSLMVTLAPFLTSVSPGGILTKTVRAVVVTLTSSPLSLLREILLPAASTVLIVPDTWVRLAGVCAYAAIPMRAVTQITRKEVICIGLAKLEGVWLPV